MNDMSQRSTQITCILKKQKAVSMQVGCLTSKILYFDLFNLVLAIDYSFQVNSNCMKSQAKRIF